MQTRKIKLEMSLCAGPGFLFITQGWKESVVTVGFALHGTHKPRRCFSQFQIHIYVMNIVCIVHPHCNCQLGLPSQIPLSAVIAKLPTANQRRSKVSQVSSNSFLSSSREGRHLCLHHLLGVWWLNVTCCTDGHSWASL